MVKEGFSKGFKKVKVEIGNTQRIGHWIVGMENGFCTGAVLPIWGSSIEGRGPACAQILGSVRNIWISAKGTVLDKWLYGTGGLVRRV